MQRRKQKKGTTWLQYSWSSIFILPIPGMSREGGILWNGTEGINWGQRAQVCSSLCCCFPLWACSVCSLLGDRLHSPAQHQQSICGAEIVQGEYSESKRNVGANRHRLTQGSLANQTPISMLCSYTSNLSTEPLRLIFGLWTTSQLLSQQILPLNFASFPKIKASTFHFQIHNHSLWCPKWTSDPI